MRKKDMTTKSEKRIRVLKTELKDHLDKVKEIRKELRELSREKKR